MSNILVTLGAVESLVNVAEVLVGDVSIDLRRLNIGVS